MFQEKNEFWRVEFFSKARKNKIDDFNLKELVEITFQIPEGAGLLLPKLAVIETDIQNKHDNFL